MSNITWKSVYDSADPNCLSPEDRVWLPGARKATRHRVRRSVPLPNGTYATEEQEILTVEGELPNPYAMNRGRTPGGYGQLPQGPRPGPSIPALFVSWVFRSLLRTVQAFFTLVLLACCFVGFPVIGWEASGHSPAGALLGLGVWAGWVAYLAFSAAIRHQGRRLR